MQEVGFCYRENRPGIWGSLGGLRLRSDHCECLFVILQQLLAEPDRLLSRGALRRGGSALINRRFETGEERLTRFATAQVPLQFFTKRIIQLFVEIVRELCKHGLAAGRSGLFVA